MEETTTTDLNEFISPKLIEIDFHAKDKDVAVRALAKRLLDHGYVRETYADAVLEREKSFPTGLPTEEIQVAIPHTDIKHCLKPGIAVCLLREPVHFFEMATLDKDVSVKIIFLLSIVVPDEQVIWLSKLTNLFQRPGFLMQLSQQKDPTTCADLLRESLRKEVD